VSEIYTFNNNQVMTGIGDISIITHNPAGQKEIYNWLVQE